MRRNYEGVEEIPTGLVIQRINEINTDLDQAGAMSRAVAHQALELGTQLNGGASCGVVFFGGEPLLCRAVIFDAVKDAREVERRRAGRFHFKVTTNGLLLDEHFLEFSMRENLLVAMSFDGTAAAHEAHRRLCSGDTSHNLLLEKLRLLLAARPYASVLMVVNPDTAWHLVDSVSLLLDEGARYLLVSLNYEADWTEDDFAVLGGQLARLARLYISWTKAGRKFYRSPFEVKLSWHFNRHCFRRERCELARRQISVSPDCHLFPCIQFVKAGPRSRWCIGHVTTGIDEAARQRLHDEAEQEKTPCRDCALRERCNHTCGCLNWQTSGSIHSVSPALCRYEQMLIPIADRIGRSLYRDRNPVFLHKHYNAAYPVLSLLDDQLHTSRPTSLWTKRSGSFLGSHSLRANCRCATAQLRGLWFGDQTRKEYGDRWLGRNVKGENDALAYSHNHTKEDHAMKTFSLPLLVSSCCVAIALLGSVAATLAQDFTYMTNNGAITITGYRGPGGVVAIPSEVGNLPVASIGDYVFDCDYGLTSVEIPGSVTTIGEGAFRACLSLTNIAIPDNVTNVGDGVFQFCESLTGITFPKGVTRIWAGAFANCYSLNSITIPDTVMDIGYSAFNGCTSLTNILVPNNVTNIGDWAFSGCSSLSVITIPNSVVSIGSGALYGCAGLTNIAIPDRVTSIEGSAFAGCSALTSITIPNSVTSIGEGAFANSYSLTSIRAPNNVTNIGSYAFSGCMSLTSIAIPDSVTSIGYQAFYGCTSLTNVTIPNSVTSIRNQTFSDCSNLTSITIPNSVTSIGSAAFYRCTSLTNITIPNGVTSIGAAALELCSSLTRITIPGSLTSLGIEAFRGCSSLTKLYFSGNAPRVESDPAFVLPLFDGANPVIYYLAGSTGWGTMFEGRPTALWVLPQPVILTTSSSFGIQTSQFGFLISWATNAPVVVEATTSPANGIWRPVSTNTLTSGSLYFSDPEWMNYSARFYRVRSP